MATIITNKNVLQRLNNIRLEHSQQTDENGEVTHTVKVAGKDISATADTFEHAVRACKDAARAQLLSDPSVLNARLSASE